MLAGDSRTLAGRRSRAVLRNARSINAITGQPVRSAIAEQRQKKVISPVRKKALFREELNEALRRQSKFVPPVQPWSHGATRIEQLEARNATLREIRQNKPTVAREQRIRQGIISGTLRRIAAGPKARKRLRALQKKQ